MVDHMLRLDLQAELCVTDENIALVQKMVLLSSQKISSPVCIQIYFSLLLLLGLISAIH